MSLIQSLKARDPDAFSHVFETHADKIYRLALRILHDEQQADGVVQNTFLKLIEHIESFEERANLSTWLYRVAYNECMQRIRRAKPEINIDENLMPTHFIDWDTIPDAVFSSQETQAQIQRAIETLPHTLKTVFILRDIEELSTAQTAQILGISESAVKVRLHRARLMLRERLATYFEDYV
ncbi:MAG: sigma-70 family RNA polymerase sigma factor [Chloroflexi bacterium]|nr:MAG: sigma-70 family RNA polymerase sigma factor [Chloroflexota bacterium]